MDTARAAGTPLPPSPTLSDQLGNLHQVITEVAERREETLRKDLGTLFDEKFAALSAALRLCLLGGASGRPSN